MNKICSDEALDLADDTQPNKAEIRTRMQRERILNAAQSCFVRSGFHSASMANIADAAEMSPGLIYRYFQNKNAIILAIIELQLVESRNKIRELRATDDLAAAVLEYFDAQDCPDKNSLSAALFLEMSAAATRDEEIATALKRYDQTVRQEFANWLSRGANEGGHALPPRVVPERALGLVCLVEGLKVRKARESDLDRSVLKNTIELIINAVLQR
jgi:AcrR family transcriptional regulator